VCVCVISPVAIIQTPFILLRRFLSASSRPVPLLQQLQQRLQSVLHSSGNSDCTEASGSTAHGNSLTDLTFAAAAACSECIPDDGLDDLLLAECECEADDLLLTCDTSSETAVDSGQMELTCDSDAAPEDCIFYYLSGYIAFKLRKFTS